MLKSQGVIFYLLRMPHHMNFKLNLRSYFWICLSVISQYFFGQNMCFMRFPELLSTKYRNSVDRLVQKQNSFWLRLIQLQLSLQTHQQSNLWIFILFNNQMKKKQGGKIYLLIGYLGSGKTTFIRNLLQNKQGQKYAVIQNQFAQGQMGIQQPLIMDQSGVPFSSFLQLPNGCICCSAKNDLVAGVQYILQNTDVQNIIVQTNGLADPAQAIKQFWFDQKLQMNASLHSIIAIISVQKYPTLKQQSLFQKQVIYANKVLLTFIDKVEEKQVQEVMDAVWECNQRCDIAKNTEYNIVQFLKGQSMFNLQNLVPKTHEHSHNDSHNHQQKKNSIHKGNHSICLRGKTTFKTKTQFQCGVGQLLWESGIKILRIKGAVCLDDSQFVYELQGVDDVFEVKPSKSSKERFGGNCVVLVIGEGMDQNEIRKILQIFQ